MLTAKNKKFCEEYIKDYNATQAYIRTYENCAPETANRAGSRLLKKEEVREYLGELQKAQFEGACITAERIGLQLAGIAFDKDKLYASSSQMKALELLQKQLGALAPQKIEADVSQQVVFIDDTDQIE